MGLGLNTLCYDGVNLSEEYNCTTASESVWNAPAKDVESYTVPGRNGTVQVDKGRFENIDIPYDCFCDRSDSTKADALRAFLTSRKGYCRLEDGYHPGEYRLASFRSGIKFEISGKTELVFDCKPQRFIDTSDLTIAGGMDLLVDKSDATYTYETLPNEAFKKTVVKAYGEYAYGMTLKHIPLSGTNSINVTADGEWTIIAGDSLGARIISGNGYSSIESRRWTYVYIDANVPISIDYGSDTKYHSQMNTVNAVNDTLFDALPIITATVNGAYSGPIATLDGKAIAGKWTASDVTGVTAVVIDCETCDAYGLAGDGFESVNMNKYITIPDRFKLTPGSNIIGAGLNLVIDRRLYTI